MKADLDPFYTENQIQMLLQAQGKKGATAKFLIPELSDIKITKEKALYLATVIKIRYVN